MENKKHNIADNYLYSNYDAIVKITKENSEKYMEFMNRVKDFESVQTLQEAKLLAQRIIPVSGDVNTFVIGNAKCTVVNNDKLFRLSIDTKEEFICYDFV